MLQLRRRASRRFPKANCNWIESPTKQGFSNVRGIQNVHFDPSVKIVLRDCQWGEASSGMRDDGTGYKAGHQVIRVIIKALIMSALPQGGPQHDCT